MRIDLIIAIVAMVLIMFISIGFLGYALIFGGMINHGKSSPFAKCRNTALKFDDSREYGKDKIDKESLHFKD
ncbi:MAG: hypothetical protein LBT20_00435 [Clostridiales bacterium]|jgi:hypothetical protein|nr:hypothetical protein [Clostridiales bacterium]